jgi:hypothetical protein
VKLALATISFAEACAFVARHHRHHAAPRGHKFSLAAIMGEAVVGVAIIGRPVSRVRDDGLTLEVTRLCVIEGLPPRIDRRGKAHAPAAVSFLYGAAARATFALGYKRLGTYILASEPGISLLASGWRQVGYVAGRSWSCQSRPRVDQHPLEPKLLFQTEKVA